MEVSSFFSNYLSSCSIPIPWRTSFIISNQPWGPSNSACLLLLVINVKCSRQVLGQSWINCFLVSANRDWLKSWEPNISFKILLSLWCSVSGYCSNHLFKLNPEKLSIFHAIGKCQVNCTNKRFLMRFPYHCNQNLLSPKFTEHPSNTHAHVSLICFTLLHLHSRTNWIERLAFIVWPFFLIIEWMQ